MNNIAIYTRKSKFTGKGESIENQIIKCKKFIEFKFNIDPENAEIFIDEDFTGKNENRPEFKRMKKKIESGEIKHIVIYQLNRFGRNARDIHNSMAICEEHNCVMYSATEGFDTSTSFGRAVMGILASLAQLETEQLSERIKDNMYTLAKMGRWLGGQSPLGFDGTREYYIDENGKERSITKLKPNKEELKIVSIIYDKYLEEQSLSQVSKWALTNNLKGKNGGNLLKGAINSILQNPVYVKSNDVVLKHLANEGYDVSGPANGNGLLRYGKEETKIAAIGAHKGIIDSDKWLKVQSILKANTEKAPRLGKTNTALLTSILRCKCGSHMRVTYGTKTKDGSRPFYYTCAMKNNSGGTRCDSKNIHGPIFEEKLIEFIKNYNKDTLIKELEKILVSSKNLDSSLNIENIDKEIEKSNNAINKLLNKLKLIDDLDVSKIILSEITKEKNNIKELNEKKSNLLEDSSEKIISQSEIFNVINELEIFSDTFDSLDLDNKQKSLKSLLYRVSITEDNKFNIEFNVKKN